MVMDLVAGPAGLEHVEAHAHQREVVVGRLEKGARQARLATTGTALLVGGASGCGLAAARSGMRLWGATA